MKYILTESQKMTVSHQTAQALFLRAFSVSGKGNRGGDLEEHVRHPRRRQGDAELRGQERYTYPDSFGHAPTRRGAEIIF